VLVAPWLELQDQLSAVQSFEGLCAAHEVYLRACSRQCFVHESQATAWRALHRLLQRAEALAHASFAYIAELRGVVRLVQDALAPVAGHGKGKRGGAAGIMRASDRIAASTSTSASRHYEQLTAVDVAARAKFEQLASTAFDRVKQSGDALQAHVSTLVRGVLAVAGLQSTAPARGTVSVKVPSSSVVDDVAFAARAGLVGHGSTSGSSAAAMLSFVRDVLDYNGYYARHRSVV
jgi:hypothetical protein